MWTKIQIKKKTEVKSYFEYYQWVQFYEHDAFFATWCNTNQAVFGHLFTRAYSYTASVSLSSGTYWFQWSLDILYKLENMIGKMEFEFSSIRLMMYSLFQK